MRDAAIRALRTFLQACAGLLLVFFTAVKGDGTFVNLKVHGATLAFGLLLAFGAALVSFIQNLLEQRWGVTRFRG